jgi:predicted Zn-dependent protease
MKRLDETRDVKPPGLRTTFRDPTFRNTLILMSRIDVLKAQLGGPRDGALLRYSLGAALLEDGDVSEAITQLRKALDCDASYSAAWKLLGRACLQRHDTAAAADAWRQGIAAAQARGDVQAAKEMRVFLKRLPNAN